MATKVYVFWLFALCQFGSVFDDMHTHMHMHVTYRE